MNDFGLVEFSCVCSVKCLGKVALNDIKPSEDSNNEATEEKIKKYLGTFIIFLGF